MPRILCEVVAHGADYVREHIQPDDIQRAESGALGTAKVAASERVHGVKTEIQPLRVMHRGQQGKYADAVSDEIGRVFGAYHAFT